MLSLDLNFDIYKLISLSSKHYENDHLSAAKKLYLYIESNIPINKWSLNRVNTINV